ncbi:MAG: sigma-70 family RNA polymerase sigma factor [Anaerolineales bacterium]|jgi:RNA polymerase sigma-70 factor (ECF subfamily)|nr:sigma-70 family RNA polymerase sigma factor [Anaerolineales bacterium]
MISDKEQKTISLKALRDGDRAEFARLVEEYSPLIYRLGLKMLNNPQDAEDILQETFIKAYKHIGKFDGRSSISTWLYRIATNEALMSLRKKRPETVSFDVPSTYETEPQEPLQIVDWCCLPEEEFLTAEGRMRLDEAAEQLPDSLRVVFVLRDIEGLSTRETAEVLDISEMAVKTRLSRARLRLREDLSTYFGKLVAKE